VGVLSFDANSSSSSSPTNPSIRAEIGPVKICTDDAVDPDFMLAFTDIFHDNATEGLSFGYHSKWNPTTDYMMSHMVCCFGRGFKQFCRTHMLLFQLRPRFILGIGVG
jgi:hypothetical protein